VDEVCVLGVPDPYSGEVPVALVVLGDEPKARVVKDDKEAKKITISILKVRSAKTREASWIEGLTFFGRA
jgi:acyl-CoA synthetase (AMP-forming)/AMP-acid ligase II